ncbi:MAG: hypothetical protein Q8O89_03600 [Nanoarchaeota archaeon]|nr:hypothetical protein [Nanoarchaeota archaeon]
MRTVGKYTLGKNFLEKKNLVNRLVFESVKIDSDIKIRKMLRHLWSQSDLSFKKYGQTKLTEQEIIVGHILREHKISAKTAYAWFNFSNAPKEILELAETNKITFNQAKLMIRGVKRKDNAELKQLGKELLEDVIKTLEVM